MNKINAIAIFSLFFLNVHAQTFDYLSCLRVYWNYRYHLMGDNINRSQHFPSDCDFLEPSGIGESGMTVIGTDPGMSLLSDGIAIYSLGYNNTSPGWSPATMDGLVYPPPASDGIHLYEGPYPTQNGSPRPTGCNSSIFQTGASNWTYCNPTDPNSEQAWKPVGSCTKCGGCTNQLNSGLGPSPILGKGGVVQFSTEAPHGMAMYIMTLATEWKLLYENGADRF
jgi:hypothetical protein